MARISRVKIMGAVAAAVVGVAVASTPATADTGHSYGYGSCTHTSDGWFISNGDTLYLKDTCADGFSAALKVDVAPIKTGEGYDFMVWNSNGNGTTKKEDSHNFPEGVKICIKAGIGHPSTGEIGGFASSWVCATT
ncbi:hypothetical protein [Streptomyces sp. NPDC006510]|uniref:hypothetical protein n=1 Tax=Streptomyces sp. NPDC006510 TaxID=3155600 RepID=UPI0033BC86EE